MILEDIPKPIRYAIRWGLIIILAFFVGAMFIITIAKVMTEVAKN